MNFQLGGITIPILAGLEFTQTYEPIGGSVLQRMQSGKAIKQTHYRKLRTTLSGQGWVPAGLRWFRLFTTFNIKMCNPKKRLKPKH
ncbi:MAG: hypothetical protein JSS07_07370 [Proteobacteria bacterium]|nr:hypothetical protein [Pseudomonadota bacterium]